MKPYLLFLLVAAVGNAIYHVGQKALPSGTNPMAILMAVYGFAFLLSALAAPFFRATSLPLAPGQVLSWPVAVLSVGVVLIEIGFLLAYRTGGSLQWSGAAVNGLAALLLLPVAVLWLRESFSLVRFAGILLTISGLALVARK